MIDAAIVGGGLAGGLIALALHRAQPDLRIALIERGETLGGNHRWSWFASDLSSDGDDLMRMFDQTEWNGGYDVQFPAYRRTLATEYRSLSSADFHDGLMREMPAGTVLLGKTAELLAADGITLSDGERISARVVIDCRPFEPSPHLRGGWQVFVGRHIVTNDAHDIERPIIMDAAVDQHAPQGNRGAYRFVYTLPLSAHEVFVEDTYYSDSYRLDHDALSGRIEDYCRQLGLADGSVAGEEVGILPVITGGDFGAYLADNALPGVTLAGARGGFVHPLTSYTIPIAVENALLIAANIDLTGPQLATLIEAHAHRHWRRTRYYRALGRMLFDAAEPAKRYRIFERFYCLKEGLIERFYAARSTPFDKLRILTGRPPVTIGNAIAALLGKGAPLVQGKPDDCP